jgi:hypothetical protein
MADPKPLSPFAPTPARIMIVILALLAVLFIVGTLTGGLSNYELLKQSASSSSEASSSSAPAP